MADKFFRSENFRTQSLLLSFAPNLFTARPNEYGKLKYGCTLIGQQTDVSKPVCKMEEGGGFKLMSMEDIFQYVAVKQWGDKALKRIEDGLIKSPFLDGGGKQARNKDTGEYNPGMGAGKFFIRPGANEDRPPSVSSTSHTFTPAKEADVYSGCIGFAVLNAFAWHHDKNGDGVSFGIQAFFKQEDGERIGGSGKINPDKWTETVADTGEAPGETKTGGGAKSLFN